MTTPPHTHTTTSKKRKRDTLTSASGNGNDSDSDYNPRKPNPKLKSKPKSSTPAARDHSIGKTLTSLPLVKGDGREATDGDGEESSDMQLPTPPKISLFSKFGKKAKTGKNSALNSMPEVSSHASRSPQSATSFALPQKPPPSSFTLTPSVPILKSTGKPIPKTNLLTTYATRSASGSLAIPILPNHIEPSFPSLDSSDFVADLLGPASSSLNPFRTGTKKGSQVTPTLSTPAIPPVKPSGIKLRFNVRSKTTSAKKVSFADDSAPSVVPSPNISTQESTSSYTPPVFGSGNSSTILKTRYHSSPSGSQDGFRSIPSSSQGSFLIRLASFQQSQDSSESFVSAVSREPTLEDRLMEALRAEIGSDFEVEDIDVPLLAGIVNASPHNCQNNPSDDESDSDSDCEIDAGILAEVEAEEAAMNNYNEVEVVQQEWQPSPDLCYALYLSDDQKLNQTYEKLYWLQMQAQWAEHGGVKNEFLTSLDGEILHLEGLKLRLEQKLSLIPNLGVVANGAANEVDGRQPALQIKAENLSPPSVP